MISVLSWQHFDELRHAGFRRLSTIDISASTNRVRLCNLQRFTTNSCHWGFGRVVEGERGKMWVFHSGRTGIPACPAPKARQFTFGERTDKNVCPTEGLRFAEVTEPQGVRTYDERAASDGWGVV